MKEYIDKAAVVAEIKRILSAFENSDAPVDRLRASTLIRLLSFIDTLEVKEVDFDDNLVEEVYSHLDDIKDTADRMTSGNFMHHRAAIKYSANVIEKVLGLIGFKAQKGE